MNDEQKKSRERQDLDFWCQLRGYAPSQLIERERPDFLLELPPLGWVAVEHTVALHPPDSKHQGPDGSATSRAIRDAIFAKLDKIAIYREATEATELWLLIVIGRPEEGLQSLREDEFISTRGFDRIEVLDPFHARALRLTPRKAPLY